MPVCPASPDLLSLYAAYLAQRLAPTSVRQYLNVVRLLHLEFNYGNPLQNYLLQSTLKGIDRIHGSPPRRKAPVTPYLLLKINSMLDNSVFDRMFWASSLVMFFGTFRKSNLMPDGSSNFDHEKQFVRGDLDVADAGLSIRVKWSKTNQYKKQCHVKRIPRLRDHPLCPVTAVEKAFASVPLNDSSPAFVVDRKGNPMTGKKFTKRLKSLISACGLDPSSYASHSFRRGSAAWALCCGIPGEIVMRMGDWKSACYLNYLDQLPQKLYDRELVKFCANMPR